MATTQKLWLQQNSAKQRQLNNLANAEYWAKRERQQRELYMMEEAQQQRELEKIYAEMYRYAEDEINRFYGKYADAEGIDITEAKKRVTQADIEAYEALAKEYVKNKDFSDRANAEMRLYNATMKINRLEMLKARIGVHLVAGVNDIDDYYEKVVTDRTRREIERQAGILGETVSVADTTKYAENIVNASFFNATYSERIWSNMDNLRSEISIQLQRGLIAGVGSREMARRVKEYAYDKSLSDAHRLMVTELRRVQTDVAMESYRQSGVERYVYLAVNPRACPICRRLNGKDYAVEGAEIANEDHPLPPMHPRCHCTTAPYVEEDDYNAWLNYLSQGGRTSDWNNMSPAERQKWSVPVVQSVITPNVESAQTVPEVENLMKQQGWFKYNDKVDLTGLDLESAKSVYRSYEKVFEKFPFFKEKFRTIQARDLNGRTYAQCWMGGGKIECNRAWYDDFEKLKKSYANDLKTMTDPYTGRVIPPWHPVGTNADSIIVHEIGHAIDGYLSYVLHVQSPNKKTLSAELRPQIAKATGVKVKDMDSAVSRYGCKDALEWFAECFCEYMTSENPRPVAQAFGERLEEIVRGANNGNL